MLLRRSPDTVHDMCHQLGLKVSKMQKRRSWTKADDELLQPYLRTEFDFRSALRSFPDRTILAIQTRVKILRKQIGVVGLLSKPDS